MAVLLEIQHLLGCYLVSLSMEGFTEQHGLFQKAWSFSVADVNGIISKDKGCDNVEHFSLHTPE